MPQLPHNTPYPHRPHDEPTAPQTRGLVPLPLQRHLIPPPGPLASRQQRQVAVEQLMRTVASQSRLTAPPDLSAAIRESLTRVSMEPRPVPRASYRGGHLRDVPVVVSEAWSHARTLIHYHDLSDRQRRVALGGAGTLGLAVLCLVGLALDPGEVVALLGIVSAVLLALLAVGHLLSATVATILSSGLLAIVAVALYIALAVLWVRLVQRPVEA